MEFRLSLKPILQIPPGGPARRFPYLVSPSSNVIAVDFVPRRAFWFFIRCYVYVHKSSLWPHREGFHSAAPIARWLGPATDCKYLTPLFHTLTRNIYRESGEPATGEIPERISSKC
jgi:hypothetical protein